MKIYFSDKEDKEIESFQILKDSQITKISSSYHLKKIDFHQLIVFSKRLFLTCKNNKETSISAPKAGVYKRLFLVLDKNRFNSADVFINPSYKTLETNCIEAEWYSFNQDINEFEFKKEVLTGSMAEIFQIECLRLDANHPIKDLK